MYALEECWPLEAPAGADFVGSDDDELLTIDKWPKTVFRAHYHQDFNWIIPMRQGRIVVRVGEREQDLSGDEWICIFPNTAHTVVHVSDNMEIFGLFIREDIMRESLAALTERPSLNGAFIRGGESMIARAFAMQWSQYRFGKTDPFEPFFARFLGGWLWLHGAAAEPNASDDLGAKLRVFLGPLGDQLARYIVTHLADSPFSWEDAASAAGISRRSLQRRLQREFGMAPAEVLTIARLDEAKRQLSDPSIRISDVAIACGFPSVSHFVRSFKKRFGITPAKRRRS